MKLLDEFREFATADWRSIRRDPMLGGALVLVLLFGFGVRWLVPWISSQFSIDLVPHYPVIMSCFVVLVTPVLFGFIVGMLLLDERDEGTLQAIGVTPLPMWRYLSWKLALPVVVSSVLTLVMFPIANLIPFRWSYVTAILVGALWAPLLALMMSSFAQNKLQGFVLMRISNLLLVAPLLAWFFPAFEPLLSIFPAYWPMKCVWLAADGKSSLLYFAVGIVFHVALIAWLYKRFLVVLRRAS